MQKILYIRKYIVLLLVVGIMLAPLVSVIKTVQGGTFTPAKLTIADSRASQTSQTYAFAMTATASTAIKQLTIIFCTTASGTCTTPTGISTTGAAIVGGSDNITGTGRTNSFGVNGTLTTVVTTPATQSPLGITISFNGITNPSTPNTSFFARVTTYSDTGTTVIDTATVAAAILTTTSIAVTASVDPTFTFTVAAVNTASSVNSATTNITTTANTIPFGTLSSGSTKIGAHDLTVATNAGNGYTVTVKEVADPPLSDGADNIDNFTGTNATPTTWSSPSGTAASVNTGFFGYTTADTTLGTGTAARFSSNKWAGATTSPLELMYSATSVSGGTETVRVGWQAEVNNLQPFGSYSGTVVLVATPTY